VDAVIGADKILSELVQDDGHLAEFERRNSLIDGVHPFDKAIDAKGLFAGHVLREYRGARCCQ
jgi:hypothetical protein